MKDSDEPKGHTLMTDGELRDELTEIMYGADWRKEYAKAHKPDVEAAMKRIHQQRQRWESAARREAVMHIMGAKTEGLYDGPDLFIKRAPIEQACIDLVGYETFKTIQEAVDSPAPQAETGAE